MRMFVIFALLLMPLVTIAETIPENGPWIAMQTDVAFQSAPISAADIVALADLDGDPLTVSADEKRMIALLKQLLGVQPVQN